jgi:hypothetical protein
VGLTPEVRVAVIGKEGVKPREGIERVKVPCGGGELGVRSALRIGPRP